MTKIHKKGALKNDPLLNSFPMELSLIFHDALPDGLTHAAALRFVHECAVPISSGFSHIFDLSILVRLISADGQDFVLHGLDFQPIARSLADVIFSILPLGDAPRA